MKFEPGVTDITIPDNMKEIYKEAFMGCTSLTSITIPDSVTEIGFDAFSGCTSLEMINVSPTFSLLFKSLVSDTKWYKDQTDFAILSAVLIAYKGDAAEVTIPNGVKIIGVGAFEGCTSLTLITVPRSLTRIAKSAFNGISGKAEIITPNGSSIAVSAMMS